MSQYRVNVRRTTKETIELIVEAMNPRIAEELAIAKVREEEPEMHLYDTIYEALPSERVKGG